MAEFLSENDILFGEWVGLAPISKVFTIPQGMRTWSLHIVPLDTGAAGNPNATLEYGIDGAFYPINPTSSLAAINNSDSVVTRTDALDKIRITIAPAVSAPNGGTLTPIATTKSVLLRLFGARS